MKKEKEGGGEGERQPFHDIVTIDHNHHYHHHHTTTTTTTTITTATTTTTTSTKYSQASPQTVNTYARRTKNVSSL
ncbi:hypothetical protein M0802_016772 [Mischocyttarus mexicanus]|nr:hypothetical protein M0802_016772 [Mischocyttarus mexicanus]